MATPVNVINGMNGSRRVADTTTFNGNFNAIYINAATVFDTLTGTYAGTVTGVTHAAGKWIYGLFTTVKLTSGDIDLYNT